MPNIYPNGAGASTGDSLVLRKPLHMSGAIWYVGSSGTDAAAPAGKNRDKPLASLAQAITNAADDDIIVLLDGYTETLTSAQAISERLTIIGEGSSSGQPTVKLTLNASSGNMLTISGAAVELRNIWIEENSQANSDPRIAVSGAGFRMRGCYVECGATDTGPAVQLASGADDARIETTTFISTATAAGSQPESAVTVAAAIARLTLESLTLDDGTYGFSNYFAFDGGAAAVTALKAENVILKGGDVQLNASTVGFFNPQTTTGGARVEWA